MTSRRISQFYLPGKHRGRDGDDPFVIGKVPRSSVSGLGAERLFFRAPIAVDDLSK